MFFKSKKEKENEGNLRSLFPAKEVLEWYIHIFVFQAGIAHVDFISWSWRSSWGASRPPGGYKICMHFKRLYSKSSLEYFPLDSILFPSSF